MIEFRKGWTGEKLDVIMNDVANGLISNSETTEFDDETEGTV